MVVQEVNRKVILKISIPYLKRTSLAVSKPRQFQRLIPVTISGHPSLPTPTDPHLHLQMQPSQKRWNARATAMTIARTKRNVLVGNWQSKRRGYSNPIGQPTASAMSSSDWKNIQRRPYMNAILTVIVVIRVWIGWHSNRCSLTCKSLRRPNAVGVFAVWMISPGELSFATIWVPSIGTNAFSRGLAHTEQV